MGPDKLIKHPEIELNNQNREGIAALSCAIDSAKNTRHLTDPKRNLEELKSGLY